MGILPAFFGYKLCRRKLAADSHVALVYQLVLGERRNEYCRELGSCPYLEDVIQYGTDVICHGYGISEIVEYEEIDPLKIFQGVRADYGQILTFTVVSALSEVDRSLADNYGKKCLSGLGSSGKNA